MSHIFTGNHVARPTINLGGTTSNSSSNQPSDIIKRAIQQREERDALRRKNAAAHRIQIFYKSRQDAAHTRNKLRAQFDQLVAAPIVDPPTLILATRLIALFFVDANSADLKRAGAWCRAVIGTVPGAAGAFTFAALSGVRTES
ncbi:hypothetical protein P7C70_g2688, partial [Phenoliferia sp. Uapishka_3]